MKLVVGLTLMVLLTNSLSADENSTETTTAATTITTAGTTLKPEEICRLLNGTCEECVKVTSCYYCKTSGNCEYYPYNHVFPKSDVCDMGQIRWGVCWLNFKAMVISLSVLGGIVIISVTICMCCCCKRRKKSTAVHENAKREREREERRIRHAERQKERESKYDEIRRKYGLVKDDHPYQKFEA